MVSIPICVVSVSMAIGKPTKEQTLLALSIVFQLPFSLEAKFCVVGEFLFQIQHFIKVYLIQKIIAEVK